MKRQLKQSKRKIKLNIVDIIIYLILLAFALLAIYPVYYVLIGSFSNGPDYMSGGVYLLPRKFTIANFEIILRDTMFWIAYRNTILRTFIGVFSALIFTSLVAYAMRSKYLRCKKIYYWYSIFTMFFSGGLVPFYLLIRVLGLYNSFWVYIIPAIFSVYNMIIIANFFNSIPEELHESAMMDGANELVIWWKIYMPLSKPVLATVALWLSVNHWNSYMGTMLYTEADKKTITLQYYLRHLINNAGELGLGQDYLDQVTAKTIAFAAIIVAILPILFFYPLIQKHFTKGITVGSLKE